VAGAFTTGLAAFFATGTLDLSAYQGLTFWIQTSAIVAAGSLSIRLCSDVAGVTTVNNIAVPTVATATANGWYPVYVDTAGALGASIASVALYVDTDLGASAVTVYIDDISTVKASGNDALNLQSLIGTNGADETWWAIRGINGVTVTLDESPAMAVANTARGYYSVNGTQTVTAYKRETIKIATGSTAHTIQDSGSAGSLITFSGGWNRTDMATQTLDTWWDGCTGGFSVIVGASKNYIKFTLMNCVRGNRGIIMTGTNTGFELPDGHFNNNANAGLYISVTSAIIGTVWCCSSTALTFGEGAFGDSLAGASLISSTVVKLNVLSNRSYGVIIQSWGRSHVSDVYTCNNVGDGFTHSNNGGFSSGAKIDTIRCDDNGISGFVLNGVLMSNMDFGTIDAHDNTTAGCLLGGVGSSGQTVIGKIITSGNSGGRALTLSGAMTGGDLIVKQTSIAEATKILEVSMSGNSGNSGSIRFNKWLGTVGNHLSYTHGGSLKATTELGANRHTASGSAWKVEQLGTVYGNSWNQFRFPLAYMAVKANKLATVNIFFNRSNINNIVSLVCPGRQIAGVDSDVISTMTVAASTWEQRQIQFTPTEDGVVCIEAWMYGGAYFVYIDDMTFSQV
jgi:hypothetical protein